MPQLVFAANFFDNIKQCFRPFAHIILTVNSSASDLKEKMSSFLLNSMRREEGSKHQTMLGKMQKSFCHFIQLPCLTDEDAEVVRERILQACDRCQGSGGTENLSPEAPPGGLQGASLSHPCPAPESQYRNVGEEEIIIPFLESRQAEIWRS